MTTPTTPKTLADLKSQDWVINVKPTDTPQAAAEEVLNQLIPDDRPVKVNFLFEEDDAKVYEAYKDSGSNDYLYMIKK